MFSDRLAIQIATAAAAAEIPKAGMLAIVEVETAGTPTEADGRTPNFLFERHIFYRELSARQPEKLKQAVKLGLAIPSWSKATQYRDERTSEMRMELLGKAKAVDEDCALRSCSWGLPQIMGNECLEVGFPNAKALVDYMTIRGVAGHIDVMVRFLKGRNLVSAIERKDWGYVAFRYNGRAYKENQYDTRLASAELKWSRKLPALEAAGVPPDYPEEHMHGEQIKPIQLKLRDLGYVEVGNPDGKWGDRTSAAVFAFQKHEGLPTTGHFDETTRNALDEANPRPVPTDRANATLDDLRDAGSTTIASADKGSIAGKVKMIVGSSTIVGAALGQGSGAIDTVQTGVDKAQQAKGLLHSVHDLLGPLADPKLMVVSVVLAGGGYIAYRYFEGVKAARLSDHQDGTHAGTVNT